MDRTNLKTYHEWLQANRAVCKGQSAEFYLVDPERTQSLALFSEAQTEPYNAVRSIEDWITVVSAEDRPATVRRSARSKDPRPRVIVEYSTADQIMTVWCGPNKWLIAGLKKSGFVYDSHTHRWRAKRADIQKAAAGIEHEKHARVELFIDGAQRGLDGPSGPAI